MAMDKVEGAINFGGLSSGLDTHKIVDALVEVERKPINRIVAQKEALSTKKQSFDAIATKLRALDEAGRRLAGPVSGLAHQITTSAPEAVSAVCGTGAIGGQFKLEVLALATNDRRYSDSFLDRDGPARFGAGTLTLKQGEGPKIEIKVDGQTSLGDVARQVNDAAAGIGATVMADGVGYRLMLVGSETGAKNAIVVTQTSGLDLGLEASANQVQAAEDAAIRIDGLTTAKRPTNTLSDIVSGVTFTLTAVTNAPATISISSDEAFLEKEVGDFVGAYNEVLSGIRGATEAGDKLDRHKLVGDATLRNLTSSLHRAVTDPIRSASADIFAPTQIGISSQKDGSLKIDATLLKAAIKRNHRMVGQIFSRGSGAEGGGMASRLGDIARRYGQMNVGLLAQRSEGVTQQTKNHDSQIERLNRQVEQREKQLKRQFYDLEETMTKLKNQGNYINQIAPSKPS